MLAAAVLLAAAGCGGSHTSSPRLTAMPAGALWDRPLTISISGLPAHTRAELRASAVRAGGYRYVSTTTVQADGNGRVRLRGNAAMRVLWTMAPSDGANAYEYQYQPAGLTARIRLAVVRGGATVARTTVRRLVRARGVRTTQLRPAQVGFYGELFTPADTSGRRPAVLLFGGSGGGLGSPEVAGLVASHGYPTLDLAYFDEPGLPKNLFRVPLEYFARALRWLAQQPGVDPNRLVVEGGSRGSEAAQLLGIHYPRSCRATAPSAASGPGTAGAAPAAAASTARRGASTVARCPTRPGAARTRRTRSRTSGSTAHSSSTAAATICSGRRARWRTRSRRGCAPTASRIA
jgi:pimeloyl-ACP methyl ester carboxylesterase